MATPRVSLLRAFVQVQWPQNSPPLTDDRLVYFSNKQNSIMKSAIKLRIIRAGLVALMALSTDLLNQTLSACNQCGYRQRRIIGLIFTNLQNLSGRPSWSPRRRIEDITIWILCALPRCCWDCFSTFAFFLCPHSFTSGVLASTTETHSISNFSTSSIFSACSSSFYLLVFLRNWSSLEQDCFISSAIDRRESFCRCWQRSS